MDEFRRFERFNLDVPARIELLQARGKRRIVETRISDVSATGGFVDELKSLPLGQAIRAEIYFLFEDPEPEGKAGRELITMIVTGSIVRSGKSGTAVNFDDNIRFESRRIDETADEKIEHGPFGGFYGPTKAIGRSRDRDERQAKRHTAGGRAANEDR
jgi:hypothetical protein